MPLRKKLNFPYLARQLLLALAVATLTNCAAVGPNYIAPETSTPPAWHTSLERGLSAEPSEADKLAQWWTTLGDPVISRLIERAIEGNLDLKEAQTRVREARAQRGVSKADSYPILDTSGRVNRSRTGSNSLKTLYSAGFDASWEIDLFGSVRRSVEAAEADLQASRESLRDVLVSLLAEVALNYVEARTYQARLGLNDSNLKTQEETHALTRARFLAGLTDELAVHQARYNLESTRAKIPTLKTGLEESLNRLAVLLGEHPGSIHEMLEMPGLIPAAPSKITVGIPADTLRRRPDIRQAERKLAAQTARIGVATADLYPRFTLAGSIGFESLSSSDLFSTASRTLGMGPSFSWRLFDAGAIRRNIEVRSAQQKQALIQYEAAVLSALEEVENAIKAFAEEQQKRDALREATKSAGQAETLALQKYQAGMVDFSEVLDAQRSLLSLEDQLVQCDGTVISDLIRLYKALGGGWKALEGGFES